ncbi:MAG: hypothetical protein COA62_09665 [Rhodobiaceae bacterium]|nr:MAG: hypothetical protein COA62_09665 [Rhodobiaceae bacterium]
MAARKKHYEKIYRTFTASISNAHDCGQYCAPLNDGQPVCCDVENAIPAASPPEWKVMKKRTNLWTKYFPDPDDKHAVKEVESINETCIACVCKGAAKCERDNRMLACRSFPFFPYLTKEGEFVGLGYYWIFEDRCWVISNLQIVESEFVKEFGDAYQMLLDADEGEYEAFLEQSAQMRRIFSRRGQIIPLIDRKGGYLKVLPKSGGKIEKASVKEFIKYGPYVSDMAYKAEVKRMEEIFADQ